MKKIFTLLLALTLLTSLVACNNSTGNTKTSTETGSETKTEAQTDEDNKIIIGVSPVPHAEITEALKDEFAKEGLDVEVNAICGDSKYIIIDEYNEEDPSSQTLNIFCIKENKNINLAEKTNKMRIKNILKTENKFIIEADKGIYELNLTQSVLKTIYHEELDSLLYQSNKTYLYNYDSNYEQFTLRLIK